MTEGQIKCRQIPKNPRAGVVVLPQGRGSAAGAGGNWDRSGLDRSAAVLAAIAINKSMPPTARVAAAKALLRRVTLSGRRPPRSSVMRSRCERRNYWLLAERRTDKWTGDGQIPVVEMYRGVGIEDQQSFERIGLVKPEIDRVHRMSGADELADYAGDARHPPEARMLAGARAEALCELAAEERRHAGDQPGALARRDGRPRKQNLA